MYSEINAKKNLNFWLWRNGDKNEKVQPYSC